MGPPRLSREGGVPGAVLGPCGMDDCGEQSGHRPLGEKLFGTGTKAPMGVL